MKKGTKVILTLVIVVVIVAAGIAMIKRNDPGTDQIKTVEVKRGDLVDKALAVGSIEPRVEVDVKSKISGVVDQLYADAGDYVKAGAPLIEIKPTPTPQEIVDAQRDIERAQITYNNAKRELDRVSTLKTKHLASVQSYDQANQDFQQARVNLQAAREHMELISKGSVTTSGQDIKSVITAPISGYILEKKIEIGDPVVPLTSYQEGTVLMTMANMNDLLFRGTVDEIDVGKLKEGMQATIKVGALPDADVTGILSRISLKSEDKDNSVVFPIEITLTHLNGNVLRAGYSANAEIMIERRDDVLTIPERLVSFKGDTAHVEILTDNGEKKDRIIQTGLSDAMSIEVTGGLKAGDKVVEKPPRKIQ